MNSDLIDDDLNIEDLHTKFSELKKKKNKYKLQVIELQNQNKILLEKKGIDKNINYMSSIIQPYLNRLLKKNDN